MLSVPHMRKTLGSYSRMKPERKRKKKGQKGGENVNRNPEFKTVT